MGAAIIATVVLGYYKDYDEAIQNMISVGETYIPTHVEVYEELFGKWQRIYRKGEM
jgi:sugar (pentulose or hexulose) kinase